MIEKINVNKIKQLIKICWIMLFSCWLFVILSDKPLYIVSNNEQMQKICAFIDSNLWLSFPLSFINYYFLFIIFCYSVLNKKLFSYKPITLSLCITILWAIKAIFSDIPIVNYVDFFILIPLIILRKDKKYKPILDIILLFVMIAVSSYIRGIFFVYQNPNELNCIYVYIYSIDVYIMAIIYYLYSRLEVNIYGKMVTIFQIRKKVENNGNRSSDSVSSCNSGDCSASNKTLKSNKKSAYFYYCSFIFLIITYGSLFIVSYFFDKVIEMTVSVICFHIFRLKDDKTFHASNDILCWLSSMISFTIVSLISLPIQQSIFSCICLAYILSTVMYLIKDYLDLRKAEDELNKTNIEDLTYEQLLKLNRDMDKDNVKIVYDYLHRPKGTSSDKFLMGKYISRRTLFRLLKKVKENYKGL